MIGTMNHPRLIVSIKSRRGVVDKPLTLNPGVPSLIPGSSSPLGETLSHGPRLHMTFAVGGILKIQSHSLNSFRVRTGLKST